MKSQQEKCEGVPRDLIGSLQSVKTSLAFMCLFTGVTRFQNICTVVLTQMLVVISLHVFKLF